MATLSGQHRQAATDRVLRFWVKYETVSDAEVYFACVISEPNRGVFGGLERGSTFDGTVPLGPDSVPVDLAIRSRVLGYIDRTDFGEWKPPPPTWPGWYGPFL